MVYSLSQPPCTQTCRFGIADESDYLIAAKFDCSAEEEQRLCDLVDGTAVPVYVLDNGPAEGDLKIIRCVNLNTCPRHVFMPVNCRKHYKINDSELQVGSLEEAVVGRMAVKDSM